jgi:hypothetical protein
VPVSRSLALRRRRHMGLQRLRWGRRRAWREQPTRPTAREHRGASAAAGAVPAVPAERTELQRLLVPARCAAQRRASALCEVCEDPTNKFIAMLRASSKL